MPKFPIVLAHGIARFDFLRNDLAKRLGIADDTSPDGFHYFRGIKVHLEANGFEARHSDVEWAGSLEHRSEQLAAFVASTLDLFEVEQVHIIAHSMGGLDARKMIVDVPGMSDAVASLTTIGTPHHGTSLADVAAEPGGLFLIEALGPIIHLDGFEDLSRERCEKFNTRAEAAEASNRVRYIAYAAEQGALQTVTPLDFSSIWLSKREGRNDGLVSVASQLWKSELSAPDGRRKQISQHGFPGTADHLNEIGWWDPNELRTLHPVAPEDLEERVRQAYLEMATEACRD